MSAITSQPSSRRKKRLSADAPPGLTSTTTPGGIAAHDPDVEPYISLWEWLQDFMAVVASGRFAIDGGEHTLLDGIRADRNTLKSDAVYEAAQQMRAKYQAKYKAMFGASEIEAAAERREPRFSAQPDVEPQTLDIDVARIEWHPENPRQGFDEAKLRQLGESQLRVGLLQPIVVRPHPSPTGAICYQGLAGERRWRAAKLVGQQWIRATVRVVDDAAALDIVVSENLEREDLNPIEQARAIASLVKTGLTQKVVGERYGHTQSWAANLMRLLELPPAIQDKVISGDIDQAKARELVPYAGCPKLLDRILADMKSDPWGWEGDRDEFKRQLEHSLRVLSRPMEKSDPDTKWSHYSCRSEGIAFETTEAERETLAIEHVPFPGKKKGQVVVRPRATNVDLWDKLQDEVLKAKKHKRENKTGSKSSDASSKPTKQKTATPEQVPAEKRAKAAKAAKELVVRIKAWRRRFLRYALAENRYQWTAADWNFGTHELEPLDHRLLLWVLARDERYAYDALLAGLKHAGIEASRSSNPWSRNTWKQLAALNDVNHLKAAGAVVKCALWPAFDQKRIEDTVHGLADMDFDLVEAAFKESKLALKDVWEWMQDPPHVVRLREFLNIHTKDQLLAQAEEWGIDTSGAKSKPEIVELLFSVETVLKLPQSVIDAGPKAKRKVKAKGKRGK